MDCQGGIALDVGSLIREEELVADLFDLLIKQEKK